MNLFMQGKLKLDGDLSIAMNFSTKLEELQEVLKSSQKKSKRSEHFDVSKMDFSSVFESVTNLFKSNSIFQFNIAIGEETKIWTVELKDGKGSMYAGESGSADVTLILSIEDFIKLFKQEVDPMNLFMQGKLKLDGDLSIAMNLSTKLEELQEVLKSSQKKSKL